MFIIVVKSKNVNVYLSKKSTPTILPEGVPFLFIVNRVSLAVLVGIIGKS